MTLPDFFAPATRAWFESTFVAPTDAQRLGWEAIAAGSHTLIHAPTGSGKTLAAFLWGIDRLAGEPVPDEAKRCRLLYVSPMKALAYDIERNLRAPLTGIRLAAARLGEQPPEMSVAMRTGDTTSSERQAMLRHPPDIVITTPESLYLMLTSQARSVLSSVRWVIVDEVHSVASSKRGSHLALSLERLDELVAGSPGAGPPQRIGLSATQRPLATIAEFLGGGEVVDGGWRPRPVAIVDVPGDKAFDLEIVVPVADMTRPEASVPIGEDGATPRSIWPAVYPSLLEQVLRHRSTIIFVNSRGAAERLAAELNRLAGEELAQSHHGSVSREQRVAIETKLKQGELRAVVATSTLELGIDMAAVDLVLLVESPASVASGLQRVGRAGHQVGAPSVARIYPKHRADLLEATVVVDRMLAGAVEATVVPRNPLDVLAQQLVAMVTARAGHRRRAVRPGPRRRPLPGPGSSQLRGRPRHAGGPLPVRRVRRAPPPHRLGPVHRDGPAPRQRQDAGGHQPGHHPRSRALHGDAGRWWSGGRARRGDGLREPAGRRVRPRIDVVADRRDNPRPGHRGPRPGPARRQAPLLARRCRRPARRAGACGRRARPSPRRARRR